MSNILTVRDRIDKMIDLLHQVIDHDDLLSIRSDLTSLTKEIDDMIDFNKAYYAAHPTSNNRQWV